MLGGGIVNQLTSSAKEGFTGALGALGLDLVWGYGSPFLPAALNAGYVMYLSKAIGAVLVGIIGGKVMPGRGRDLSRGAMTVIIHDLLKSTLAGMGVPLGAYVGANPIVAYGAPAVGVPQLGTPMHTSAVPNAYRMGAYIPMAGMGGYLDGADGTGWDNG